MHHILSSKPLHELLWRYTICWIYFRSYRWFCYGLEAEEEKESENRHRFCCCLSSHLVHCSSLKYSRSYSSPARAGK